MYNIIVWPVLIPNSRQAWPVSMQATIQRTMTTLRHKYTRAGSGCKSSLAGGETSSLQRCQYDTIPCNVSNNLCGEKYSTAILVHWRLRWRRLFKLRLSTNNTGSSAIFYLLYIQDNQLRKFYVARYCQLFIFKII